MYINALYSGISAPLLDSKSKNFFPFLTGIESDD